MKLLLDANRYGDLTAGNAGAVAVAKRATHIVMPVVVLGELRFGFSYGTRAAKNEATLLAFLASPLVSVADVTDATTHHFAALSAQLRRQGTPLPVNDVWIAALAVQHGLTLFTRDRHFDRLPQVPRI